MNVNPAPVNYVIYTESNLPFLPTDDQFWGLNAGISRYAKITDFYEDFLQGDYQ